MGLYQLSIYFIRGFSREEPNAGTNQTALPGNWLPTQKPV